MNHYKHYLSIVIIASFFLLQGCTSTPISLGVSQDFNRSEYDMENPKKVSVTENGFQLFLFIPIYINSRHQRAYSAIEAQAGDGLISDVRVKESWIYALVGTIYETTIEANIYPRK